MKYFINFYNKYMLDIKALKVALEQLEAEKKISHEKVVDAVEKSLAAAYQKEYGKLRKKN